MNVLTGLVLTLFLACGAAAEGVGGSSGGSNGGSSYAIEICDTTDAGVVRDCRQVMVTRGPGEEVGSSVPNFFRRFNKWFIDRGFTAPPPPADRN